MHVPSGQLQSGLSDESSWSVKIACKVLFSVEVSGEAVESQTNVQKLTSTPLANTGNVGRARHVPCCPAMSVHQPGVDRSALGPSAISPVEIKTPTGSGVLEALYTFESRQALSSRGAPGSSALPFSCGAVIELFSRPLSVVDVVRLSSDAQADVATQAPTRIMAGRALF